MELMLDRVCRERYERLFCTTEMHEEMTEMIITDKSPDVLRIVKGCADVYIKDKGARDGKIDTNGNIKGVVLYIAEGETDVRKLDFSIPFSYVTDAKDVNPSSKVKASVCLKNFDVQEVNPRKVSVKATLELSVSAYQKRMIELANEINVPEGAEIHTKKRGIELYNTTHIEEKSFVINDDIELTSSESDLHSLLTSSVSLSVTDTKIIGNKAILKGTSEITYMYKLSDGAVGSGEYELPFSQILDIEGMTEEDDLENILSVSAFELEPQYDATGKARYMTVSISAEVCSVVRRREKVEMLDDLYSIGGELTLKKENLSCESFADRAEKRVSVSEGIETENGVKRVLDVDVKVFAPQRRREENEDRLVSDAVINVVYIGTDDVLYNVRRRKNVVCPVSVMSGNNYEASARVNGKGYSVGVGNEINVRFFTDFDVTETNDITVPVISEAELSEVPENKAHSFTVSVVRLSDEYDLWSLAKEHTSTVEEIKLANNITEDTELKKGRMVLVPKRG